MCVIDRIISELKSQGFTQIDLANHLKEKGVTKQTITDWKSGKSTTYYQLIVEIADFLGVTTDYLLRGIENTNEKETHAMLRRRVKFETVKNAMMSCFTVEKIGFDLRQSRFSHEDVFKNSYEFIELLIKNGLTQERIGDFIDVGFKLNENADRLELYYPKYSEFKIMKPFIDCEDDSIKKLELELIDEHEFFTIRSEELKYEHLLNDKKGGA